MASQKPALRGAPLAHAGESPAPAVQAVAASKAAEEEADKEIAAARAERAGAEATIAAAKATIAAADAKERAAVAKKDAAVQRAKQAEAEALRCEYAEWVKQRGALVECMQSCAIASMQARGWPGR